MKLLVDLGNTRLKWALWDGAQLRDIGAVAHAGEASRVAGPWQDLPRVDAVWVASVAGAALEQGLTRVCTQRWSVGAQFMRSRAQACGVRNAYAEPERLGVDRFLALIAAHANAHVPTVIASCGTALTLDALCADGTHQGGLIAASPELALVALRSGTAQLGAVPSVGRIVEIADNSADAMESGAWLAAVALVERFVAQAAARFAQAPALVLTGGGAKHLGERLAPPHRIDADLVLKGLACYVASDE